MSIEAMQMALHTLEGWANYGKWVWPESALEQAKRNTTESITALRQALETEQEPVAFINVEKQKLEWAKLTSWHTPTIVNLPKIPLYTSPPKREWVPEALRLADALDAEFVQGRISNSTGRESAVELRRLALKQWVGLTDEEIQDLSYLSQKIDEGNSPWFDRCGFARAIEQALKEKNQW
jgi:hypothetical protein